jgi:DNA polymerase (family X)
MDNFTIAEHFSLLSQLIDINGHDSFKAKNYASAAFTIEKLPVQLTEMGQADIFATRGIGAGTGKKIMELLETGELQTLKEYLNTTPSGVVEMLRIKGIGPKKIHIIWQEIGIETIGELLYACQENRLKLYKGFGEKTQQNITESIQFYQNNIGHFLYAQVLPIEPQVTNYLQQLFGAEQVHLTGSFLRHLETIECLEYVIPLPIATIKPKFNTAQPPQIEEETTEHIIYKLLNGLRLKIFFGQNNWQQKLFTLSCSTEFYNAFTTTYPNYQFTQTQNNFATAFTNNGLHVLPTYLREHATDLQKAAQPIPQLIQPNQIKGIIHSHSNWSDGGNTIEEMIIAAQQKGFEYLVISDHSKTASYANGLQEDRLKAQHQQIDELNNKYPNFKVFKSIESDILNDGNLDYTNSILSTFDVVIASIHSNLKMPQDKAMARLLTAIENPYTNILGHLTGRLLLSRNGYPINHKTIIDACAANNVVIELNAHPSRLDIDWRYIDYALQKNVLISINPDAHYITGFDDVQYGVYAAQKAWVTAANNLSSFGLTAFTNWVQQQQQKRKIN